MAIPKPSEPWMQTAEGAVALRARDALLRADAPIRPGSPPKMDGTEA